MSEIISRNNVQVLEADGPVLIFGNGFGCNQSMWDGMLPHFEKTHRQVVFDYVGSGQSDINSWSDSKYASLTGYVQDLLDVCDALSLTKDVTFVGHSVSASIGLLASIARPELFKELVLIGPSPCFLNDPPHYLGGFERKDLEGLINLMDQNYMGWADYLAPVVSGENPSSNTSSRLKNSFCSTDPYAAKAFAKATFFADNRDDLKNVSNRCLILQHARDALVPVEIGDYLHDALEGSELKRLDVSGHCAHMSHPNLVADAMNAFMN